MSYILAAGYEVTNDPDRIDTLSWDGAGDVDGDSDVDLNDVARFGVCFTGAGGEAGTGCEAGDSDDGDVDHEDWRRLLRIRTVPGELVPHKMRD